MDDAQFYRLIHRFTLSPSGYRKVRKGVKKRLARHMLDLGCRNTDQYLRRLDEDHEARRHCEKLLTVSISRFFRDRELWRYLETDLIPEIIGRCKDRVAVWSAGCASGEEPYSFMILWRRNENRFDPIPELALLATDMNPDYLERCRTGRYMRRSLREVDRESVDRYFDVEKKGKWFKARPGIKEGIRWQVHHLVNDDPPETNIDLIFLRNNLLTYHLDPPRIRAFRKVVSALATGGFLVIGSHESLPGRAKGLTPVSAFKCIFRKTD